MFITNDFWATFTSSMCPTMLQLILRHKCTHPQCITVFMAVCLLLFVPLQRYDAKTLVHSINTTTNYSSFYKELNQITNHKQPIGNRSVMVARKANSNTLITDHECFQKNSLEECYGSSNATRPYKCTWCELWCVYMQEVNDCGDLSHNFDGLFSQPVVYNVIPKVIYTDTPTLVSISGAYLDMHQSDVVFNMITKVVFNEIYPCEITLHNYTLIRCILEAIHQADTISMKLFYTREVYDRKQDTQELDTDFTLEVLRQHEPDSTTDSESSINLTTMEILIGLAIGASICSLAWVLYANRHNVQAMVETIERTVFLRNVKKELIDKGLYMKYVRIDLKTKLGDGNFGKVYFAQVETENKQIMEVAIKKLKKDANLDKTKMFLTEGIRMSGFKHERILSPMAISIDQRNHTPFIILPIMVNGDLCRYLRKNKVFPMVKLLTFSLQIAEGMEYLTSVNVIHGDLAARNCLLDDQLQVKIGDFGLSRQIYHSDYVTINDIYRPIRWMALECLTSKKPRFTFKSDVWAFGVVLWEIFTLGSYPYEDFHDTEISRHLQSGYRLHRPLNCPELIFDLMQNCWLAEPSERYTFSQLRQNLSDHLCALLQETNEDDDSTQTVTPEHYINYTTLAERFLQCSSSLSSTPSVITNHNNYELNYNIV